MRESALFGTMFGLGAGAVLVGVAVSRLVGGQAAEKAVVEPPAAVVETASPPALVGTSPPAAVAPLPAGIAMAGQQRPVPRKHRRPPAAEEVAPKPAPVAEATAPTASIASKEAPVAAPPRAEVADAPVARDAPVAIVRGGVVRPASPAPGARIIQVEPQER